MVRTRAGVEDIKRSYLDVSGIRKKLVNVSSPV